MVTGKLGDGKTISAVAKIREYLARGCIVATNLNINLEHFGKRSNKTAVVYRIPDKPTIEDLRVIGSANKTYDERKNGLLVLDECGTWFNSRTWADKSRQDVINWFLHARKLGWDIIFIVQNVALIDKQARLALGQQVVYCRRTDKVPVPIIGPLIRVLLMGFRLRLPKFHLGTVRYGTEASSIVIDRWFIRGHGLYRCYDTKQQFSDYYDNGVFTYLPPYYTHGRYQVPWNARNIMRITKIYFRKVSRIAAFMAGAGVVAVAHAITAPPDPDSKAVDSTVNYQEEIAKTFEGYTIASYANWPNKPYSYVFNLKGEKITSERLRLEGYKVKSRGKCEALIVGEHGEYTSIFCN